MFVFVLAEPGEVVPAVPAAVPEFAVVPLVLPVVVFCATATEARSAIEAPPTSKMFLFM
jgi:hypothetical protein